MSLRIAEINSSAAPSGQQDVDRLAREDGREQRNHEQQENAKPQQEARRLLARVVGLGVLKRRSLQCAGKGNRVFISD